jgi:hypothetical protein
VVAGADETAPGRGFPLEVVRVWSKDLVPAEWSDRALAPLHLRLEEARRREDSLRVEETRLYRAYAFALGDVSIPPPRLRAVPKAGGEERTVSADAIRVRVRPELDPAAPGPPELPTAPPARRVPWFAWAAVALLAAAAAIALRRREPAAPAPAPAPPPHETALARLRELRSKPPEEAIVAASAVVRGYVAIRFDVRAPERTTEEVLAAVPALAAFLGPCDLVKFAAHRPTDAERARLLDLAEAFVREAAA